MLWGHWDAGGGCFLMSVLVMKHWKGDWRTEHSSTKALRIKYCNDIFLQNRSAMETRALPVEATTSSTHGIYGPIIWLHFSLHLFFSIAAMNVCPGHIKLFRVLWIDLYFPTLYFHYCHFLLCYMGLFVKYWPVICF